MPKEMNWTHFAQKVSPETGENPVDLGQGQPKVVHWFRLISGVGGIFGEGSDRVGDFHRFCIDGGGEI